MTTSLSHFHVLRCIDIDNPYLWDAWFWHDCCATSDDVQFCSFSNN